MDGPGADGSGYIIFVANAFALMGLRQLYFLIDGLLQRVIYLGRGLAIILSFIGVKLVLEALHRSHVDDLGAVPVPRLGTGLSLGVIVAVLGVTVLVSLVGKGRRSRSQPQWSATNEGAPADPAMRS